MRYRDGISLLLVGLLYSLVFLAPVTSCSEERDPETPDWRMTLKTIRNGIHKIDTYLNVALDLFGGDDGLCRYKCSDGEVDCLSLCWLYTHKHASSSCHDFWKFFFKTF